jgi:hypothetical protein
MIIYVPLIPYKISDEGQKVCDGVLQWFYDKQDAIDLYPYAIIQTIEIRDVGKKGDV